MTGEGTGDSAGSEVSAEATLTFAVGNDTDVAEAQATEWDDSAAGMNADESSSPGAVPVWVWALAGLGVLVLVAALIAAARAKGGRRD